MLAMIHLMSVLILFHRYTLSALAAATTTLGGRAYVDNYAWDPSRMTKFHVVSKQEVFIFIFCAALIKLAE